MLWGSIDKENKGGEARRLIQNIPMVWQFPVNTTQSSKKKLHNSMVKEKSCTIPASHKIS